jgi:NodT family efflux transporter outer membrane factor (OMF) lipoprotein
MLLKPFSCCVTVAACLSIAGCTVGPDYNGPPQIFSPGRAFARASSVSTKPGPGEAQWWIALRDPQLDQLETAALAANSDLAVAKARIRESRAQLQSQRAQLRPTTGSSALLLHTHGGSNLLASLAGGSAQSEAAADGSGAQDSNLYDVGFDASWEIDLFGGQRRAVEGAAASEQAQIDDLADAEVSLTAEIARAYIGLREAQRRLTLNNANVGLQQKMLGLTRRRIVGGTATDLDAERLESQLAQTLESLPSLRVQIDDQLDQLSTLTGRVPGDLDTELKAPGPIPLPPRTVAIADPAELLRRRPDIRAAERGLAAANAAIGQHIADYFPKLQLLGDIGYSSTDISDLFSANSLSAIGAPFLSWKPFDFGRTKAAIEQARASNDEALANYQGVVLKALADAETALSRYGNQRAVVVDAMRANTAAERAASTMRLRYAGGTATLIDELDTEREQVQTEQSLAEAVAELTSDYVGLQKSLGLGWD